MANTKTDTYLLCGHNKVVKHITVRYVDGQETDLVVYDSSDVATKLNRPDTLDCSILAIEATVSTALTAKVYLEFDATTDVLALDLPPTMVTRLDYKKLGGINNYAGTGITGDITLTTTGLSTGDLITIMLVVKPH